MTIYPGIYKQKVDRYQFNVGGLGLVLILKLHKCYTGREGACSNIVTSQDQSKTIARPSI